MGEGSLSVAEFGVVLVAERVADATAFAAVSIAGIARGVVATAAGLSGVVFFEAAELGFKTGFWEVCCVRRH